MPAIQVRDVPPELHEAIRQRARAKDRTIGQYVLELIRQDLRRPDDDEWMEAWEALDPVEGVDVVETLDAGRADRL